MARHTPCHRVNTVLDLGTLGFNCVSQLAYRVLRLGHSHTITGHDNHALSVLQQHSHFIGLSAGDFTGIDFIGINNLATGGHFAKQYIGQRTVHRHTHNARQNQPRGSDQGTGNNQYRVAENKTRESRCDTRVGIQQCNHYRHIGTADRHYQEQTQQ